MNSGSNGEAPQKAASAKSEARLAQGKGRKRTVRNFPAAPFKESFEFARRIYEIGGGQPIRRLTLFDELGKSSESGASRMLVTTSSKYGLTKGSYTAEFIELTSLGLKVVGHNVSRREQERAKVEAAIFSVPPFASLYQKIVSNKLPAISVLVDSIKDFGVSENAAEEAADTFIVNLRDVGLLKTLSGAERVVSVDMMLDDLPGLGQAPQTELDMTYARTGSTGVEEGHETVHARQNHQIITADRADFETTAFYISPIGDEGSDRRKHADLFASSIVEPALEQSKIKLLRADQIQSPGIITRQILDYIINSRLVIVDLSFNNPNVFYELAIRHLMRKPTVQIMRSRDSIPFDINQSRTIKIDDTDIYVFVPKIPVYIAEISAQIRQALDNPDSVDNPISIYFPDLAAAIKET